MRTYDFGLAIIAGVFALLSGFVSAPFFGSFWPALIVFWAVMTLVFGLFPGSAMSKSVRIATWGFIYVVTVDAIVVSFSGISLFLGVIGGFASLGIGLLIHSARNALRRSD